MRDIRAGFCIVFVLMMINNAEGQMIVDDFDSQPPGAAPEWKWWSDGKSGAAEIDAATYRGLSGKSVKLARTVFDGAGFGFGQNFSPLDGPADLTYYFRVDTTSGEILTAIGGNNADGEVAWWVGVGGEVGDAIGTYSEAGGWNHVLDVSAETWYGVTLEIDPSTFSYDITVWEDGDPANTATESGIPFRNGVEVVIIDQIQFGNFSGSTFSSSDAAFVDDVRLVGSRVFEDGFESWNTGSWSRSTASRTKVTSCGQIVVTDAILEDDLDCPTGAFESYAIKVGASNITVDLGGNVISGHPIGVGVTASEVDGITIKNGTIESYSVGVDVYESSVVTVRDLKISNLESVDPNVFISAVRMTRIQEILVRDSFFQFLPVAHKNGILAADSKATIDNIEMSAGGVGVDISGSCDVTPRGSNTTVTNSRFVDVTIAGVLAQCTEISRVAFNEFDHNEMGVLVDNVNDQSPGNISGLVIEENSIHDGYLGVHFMGNFNCSILNNVMHDGWRGIYLDSKMGCPPDEHQEGCFYATGNLISGNHVTDYFIDLSHHPYATGNTWTDNICETSEGTEIPACIPP